MGQRGETRVVVVVGGRGGVKHMCDAEALLDEWGVQKRANDAECLPLTAYRDQA